MIGPIASGQTPIIAPQRSEAGEARSRSGFSPLPSTPGDKPSAPAPAVKEKPERPSTVGRPLLGLDNEQFAALHNEQVQREELPAEGKPDKEDAGKLTPEEEEVVRDLRQRDAEVRRHERAHAAAGGAHAGAPSYDFQTGPDGKRYAVGGEVAIDTAPVNGDLGATIAKMEQIKSAALAPANPSGQDRAVAAAAEATRLQAEAELRAQKAEETSEAKEPKSASEGDAKTDEVPRQPEPRQPPGQELNISV